MRLALSILAFALGVTAAGREVACGFGKVRLESGTFGIRVGAPGEGIWQKGGIEVGK